VILVLIVIVTVELGMLGIALVVFGLMMTRNLNRILFCLEDEQINTLEGQERDGRDTKPIGELELRLETTVQLFKKPPIIDNDLSARFKRGKDA
jgi:hypothetical protein